MSIATEQKKKNKKFLRLKHYKHFLLLVFWPVLLLWFFYCERSVVPKYIMHSPLDDFIPFTSWFIIPYEIWYGYLAWGFLYLGFKNKNDFIKLCLLIYAGHIACYTFYLLFPNGQSLRPLLTESDYLSCMIRNLYEVDTPTNVFPSLHVFDALAVHICIRPYLKASKKYGILIGSFLIMFFSAISTVFVKQHSILDLLAGVFLVVLLYAPVSKLSAVFRPKAGQYTT